ncbi:phosphatase PAP2 family protein [bacterium]|nr:phosphatase PAP2 family protein [bacterium]
MKFHTILIILVLSFSSFALDFYQEAIHWGFIGFMGAGTYAFSQTKPFFNEPIFDVSTNSPLAKTEISPGIFYLSTSAITGLVFLAPVKQLERDNALLIKYNHIKGFVAATAATSMLTGFSKDLFGISRPDADARINSDYSERHTRDSFPSGHSSFAFCNATYSALYLWKHVGDNNMSWTLAKTTTTASLIAGATAVACSRVDKRHHRTSDVVTGAFLGGAVAVGTFILQENHSGKLENISLEATSSGIAITWRF